MTNPQPKETHFNKTQPRLYQNPSQVSTNRVRVHAAHNHEHGCYNSFTLYRGCTHSPWVMIILGSRIPIVRMEYPYTLPRCALGNHYKAFQWFPLAYNIPSKVSLPVWASHPPRSPLLCLRVPAIAALPIPSHYSAITTSLNISAVLPSQLPRTAGWYAKTRFYHILRQVIPI
jgi:hypothetical protein